MSHSLRCRMHYYRVSNVPQTTDSLLMFPPQTISNASYPDSAMSPSSSRSLESGSTDTGSDGPRVSAAASECDAFPPEEDEERRDAFGNRDCPVSRTILMRASTRRRFGKHRLRPVEESSEYGLTARKEEYPDQPRDCWETPPSSPDGTRPQTSRLHAAGAFSRPNWRPKRSLDENYPPGYTRTPFFFALVNALLGSRKKRRDTATDPRTAATAALGDDYFSATGRSVYNTRLKLEGGKTAKI